MTGDAAAERAPRRARGGSHARGLMSGRPLGFLVLLHLGALLAVGGGGGALLRAVLGETGDDSPMGWSALLTTAGAAVVLVAWLVSRWRRRAAPVAPDSRDLPLGAWLAAAGWAGVGIGIYSGALQPLVGGARWSAVLGVFLFLPVACVTCDLALPPRRAAAAQAFLLGGFLVAAQVATSLARHGHLFWRHDLDVVTAGFAGAALLFLFLLAPLRDRVLTWADRQRVGPPPTVDAPPQRA